MINAQIKEGKYSGAIPRAVEPLKKGRKSFVKRFNRRVTEIRVDYVQHALSAMIKYVQILKADSKTQ